MYKVKRYLKIVPNGGKFPIPLDSNGTEEVQVSIPMESRSHVFRFHWIPIPLDSTSIPVSILNSFTDIDFSHCDIRVHNIDKYKKFMVHKVFILVMV